MQNASLPRGHASIRIQQYVGIILTCMGLVLLRDNDMDREDCSCGEESSTWESQRVTSYGVFHTWCINGFNCSRLVTLIKYISGYFNILTSLYLALFTALEKKIGHYMVNNGLMNKSRLLAPEDV